MALLVPQAGEAEVTRYTYRAYVLFYMIFLTLVELIFMEQKYELFLYLYN